MINKQKKKIIFSIILAVIALTVLLIHISGSNKIKYINIPAVQEYSTQEEDSASDSSVKKASELTDKLDLMPLAAKKATPSVVNISIGQNVGRLKLKKYGINIYRPLQKRYHSLGSGVIVTPDGYILTNNHVVESFAGKIQVELGGNRSYKAKIVGKDPKTDLAVIKINAQNLPCIKFGDSDKAGVGDIVLAVGNPFGIGESVTMGIISAIGRSNIGIVDYENFIQTDAAINPGNSGGALVNLQGELIGINTAILTKSGGYEGISFAIPSNMALMIFKEIAAKGKVERGWIGIAIQDINAETAKSLNLPTTKGIIVLDVVPDSPADTSGLQKGDVLISFNEFTLKNKSHLRNLVAYAGIGNSIKFRVLRKNAIKEMPIKISKLPNNMNFFDVKNFSFPAR